MCKKPQEGPIFVSKNNSIDEYMKVNGRMNNIIFTTTMPLVTAELLLSLSSLHCNISLSFYSFLYNAVFFETLKLSASDVKVSQKGSNGNKRVTILWVGL